MARSLKHVTVRNGLTLAYVVALVNSALILLVSFGVNMNDSQQAAIVGFVNVAVMLAARVLHLPERTPAGGTVQLQHVPVLTSSDPPAVLVPPIEVPPSATPPAH